MKRILIGLFLIGGFAFADQQATTEYIVWTKDATVKNFQIETVGGSKVKQLKHINGVVARLTPTQAATLRKKGLSVEKNGRMHVLGKRSKVKDAGQMPWGIKAVQAPEAQKLENGSGEGVTICVVDTGIADDAPALVGRVTGGQAIVKSTTEGKAEYYDDMGHGTHVSGTIAGNADGLLGVAPKASLYAIKVLDANGSGTEADVADGLKACIGHGSVVNLSLGGGGFSQAIQDSLDALVAAGVEVACAAGNDPGPVENPANQKGCTAVSAVDSKGKLAIFSARGDEVAWAGPGVGVKSCVPGGGYETWDGTSMATPHVAGTMAVRQSSKQAALKGLSLGLPKTQQGGGQINALKTVQGN